MAALIASASALQGQFLDKIDVPGETVFTAPDANGGFVSCSFTDYPWEAADGVGETEWEAAAPAVDTVDGLFDDIIAGLGACMCSTVCAPWRVHASGDVPEQGSMEWTPWAASA